MVSRKNSQRRNNGRSNKIRGQKDNNEEVPFPSLRLTETPELINLVASAMEQGRNEEIHEETPISVAMALAYTQTTYIETSIVEQGQGIGSFQFELTDQVRLVVKLSATMAYSVAKRVMFEKEPMNPFFTNSKLRLHVHGGNTPIDNLSACSTIATSFLSLAMNKPVRKNLAMTGAITLTGQIPRITGVKEKTIAAKRSQVKMIIFPEANHREFQVLEDHVKEGLDARFVDNYSQVFELAFGYDQ